METNDAYLLDCATYEQYLNTFISRKDLFYMRNIELCHTLVTMGYRSQTEIYTPTQFEDRKAIVKELLMPVKKSTIVFSDHEDITDPLLIELAKRERLNVVKSISTIIFLQQRLKSGFEISGYIDYAESLRLSNLHAEGSTDWKAVFQGRKKLRPKKTDLSFFDWHKGNVKYNQTENYRILHDAENGLIFMHRGDHKEINVSNIFDRQNSSRTTIYSEIYGIVFLYDHKVRKMN